MKKLLHLIMGAVIIGLIINTSLRAEYDYTIVSGPVWGLWSPSGSPYLAIDTVYVPEDSTLTIEPGVQVIFQGHDPFLVYGYLQALGTVDDSILFTAADTTIGWLGLQFHQAPDSSHLSFCLVQYGKGGYGIRCKNSNPVVSHCTIRWNSGGWSSIFCEYTSNPTISNNTICENMAARGAIFNSGGCNPIIVNNIIRNNFGTVYGGGICCYGGPSSPTISGNLIADNTANGFGGGIYCMAASPLISGNLISGNTANNYGGGIDLYSSAATINGNVILGNSASTFGGGIYCRGSSPNLSMNIIRENTAGCGGGIYCWYGSNPMVEGNEISQNYALGSGAAGKGGGIYFDGSQITDTIVCNKNTFYGNTAENQGGSAFFTSTTLNLVKIVNSIFWGNNSQFIFQGVLPNATVTYNDIQGGWPGTGNISFYPDFVDTSWNDYRLSWGSPCIDSGDPNPFYNDPDYTRADMGCYYYDQSTPVRVLLTPHGAPMVIPAGGGAFDYTIQGTNKDSVTHQVMVWCDATLPSGAITDPLFGPVSLPLSGNATRSCIRTQNIPANAPAGIYSYHAYAVVSGLTSTDSFLFVKLGLDTSTGLDGWANVGENFLTSSFAPKNVSTLKACSLNQNYPNPCNPTTTISFVLSQASRVNLALYDVSGRQVAELVNGWRESGVHEVTFDGSALPSGVYLYKLLAGEFEAIGKMVLVK